MMTCVMVFAISKNRVKCKYHVEFTGKGSQGTKALEADGWPCGQGLGHVLQAKSWSGIGRCTFAVPFVSSCITFTFTTVVLRNMSSFFCNVSHDVYVTINENQF